MIIGAGPLPDEKSNIRSAVGLRTAQFVSLLKQGNKIYLITIENETDLKKDQKFSDFTHIKVKKNQIKKIKQIFADFSPEVLIGVNNFPSFIASQIVDNKTPFWADLNGWIMAELQAQASVIKNNAFVPMGYQIEKNILKKADKISTVSLPQKHAVYGELAFLGRLSAENFAYPLMEVIQNSTEEFKTDQKIKNQKLAVKIPADAFVVTQIGGFNAWFDEETLFKALEKAMAENAKIHFLTTGGIIKGVDEKSYPRFQERVQKSRFKNRFYLLGWVKTEEIPLIYERADCLINVDFDCAETMMGARNRLNEGLKFGLPIITTLGSEIAEEIVKNNAGLGSKNGDYLNLAKNIINLSKDKKLQKKLVKNGQNLLKEKYSAKICIKPLMEWLKNPQKAPDNGKMIKMRLNYLKAGSVYLKERGLKEFFKKIWQKIT